MASFFKMKIVKPESWFYFDLSFEISEQLIILHEFSIKKGFLKRIHGLKFSSNLFKNKRYIQFSVWNLIGLNCSFQICWEELKNVPQEQKSSHTYTHTPLWIISYCFRYINNLKCNRNDHDVGKVLYLAVH